jgi:hypothetical protein
MWFDQLPKSFSVPTGQTDREAIHHRSVEESRTISRQQSMTNDTGIAQCDIYLMLISQMSASFGVELK